MRFILLAEGQTEKVAVGDFLRRWLDEQLKPKRVGIKTVSFDGNGKFAREFAKKARYYLSGPEEAETIAVIGLLDLFELQRPANPAAFEGEVGDAHFRMFFASYETEAWLLSQPEILPRKIRDSLPSRKSAKPEEVNKRTPPSKLLNQLYLRQLNRAYKKDTDGGRLFEKLDPEVARAKCPRLKAMLDEMLKLARGAGL